MITKLTEEQRKFISSNFIDEKKTGKKIIEEFGEKFGFIPSAATINKYRYYNETAAEREVKPNEEKSKKEAVELTTLTDDTRKIKNLFDFSSGEIPDEIFDKIVAVTGKNKKKVFDLLKQCYDKGLTKIDLKTGEVSRS